MTPWGGSWKFLIMTASTIWVLLLVITFDAFDFSTFDNGGWRHFFKVSWDPACRNPEEFLAEKHPKDGGSANISSYCSYPLNELEEYHLLHCAVQTGEKHQLKAQILGANAPSPTLALMFISRGNMPHEPLWRRFLKGQDGRYSLYAHTSPGFEYSKDSIFYGHQIQNIKAARYSFTLVKALKRLLAYAILDEEYGPTNSWFVLLCEVSIPLRSFNFTYDYLINSQHSFVESFLPNYHYLDWETLPEFNLTQMRKGELWMAVHRRHACMVLDDWHVHYKFKSKCHNWCKPDEQYIQTLLAMIDPQGIENRTIMYVDWGHDHGGSPFKHHAQDMPVQWFEDIQGRTIDREGQFHDTSYEALEFNITTRICYYNNIPNSPCFLFARKVGVDATKYLNSLPPIVLGY